MMNQQFEQPARQQSRIESLAVEVFFPIGTRERAGFAWMESRFEFCDFDKAARIGIGFVARPFGFDS